MSAPVSSTQILSYQQRLSGPLLDRIDLVVNVRRVDNKDLLSHSSSSYTQHERAINLLITARDAQANRYNSSGKYNSSLSTSLIKQHIDLDEDVKRLLAQATDKLNVSARSYFKIIKVARTIADIEASSKVTSAHVAEALQYRLATS